jgi:GTP-sensing pleiotropic transcriptional regulator CodY
VDVVAVGRIESLLSEHGAMTTSALAERANGNRLQILAALRELECQGRLRIDPVAPVEI